MVLTRTIQDGYSSNWRFHTFSCLIGAIGKLWGDGGLRDLLVDSDVYAGSTADLMLAGKQFHHAVSFFDWCKKKENVNGSAPKFWKSLTKTQNSFDKDQGSCLAVVKKVEPFAAATHSIFVLAVQEIGRNSVANICLLGYAT